MIKNIYCLLLSFYFHIDNKLYIMYLLKTIFTVVNIIIIHQCGI